MLFTQVAILAAATLVAAEAAPQPHITQPAVLRRDISIDIDGPNDVKTWIEGKASAAGQDVDDWVKSHQSEAEQWASEQGGDAKTWVDGIASRASTALDGVSSRVRTAIDEASASATAAANGNDNAAASVGGQAGVVALMAAVGAAVFGFMA
ncbi:hypothetical protein IL306_013242 [Fusarium sp. DS 682]|nr:hypothetical protein IL306_013242 [Fusarium sp. DS 682]